MDEQETYFENDGQQTATEPPVSESQQQATQQLSPAQKSYLEDQQRYQQAHQQQPPVQSPQPQKSFMERTNDELQGLTPAQFRDMIIETTREQNRNETAQELAVERFRRSNPDLIPYEAYIGVAVNKAQQEALNQGKTLTYDEAISAGIREFRQTFGQTQPGAPVKELALNMDVAGGQKPQPKGPNFATMSDEEFRNYRAEHVPYS